MSTFGLPAQAIGGIAAVAGGVIDTILIRQGRNIAGIYPDVVVKESHRDEMEITEHPIESGASISDHAFKRPAELLVQFGWSDSSCCCCSFAWSDSSLHSIKHAQVLNGSRTWYCTR